MTKFVVDEDTVIYGVFDDDDDFDEQGELSFVVVAEECNTAGWTSDDVVCRCAEKEEAERIAKLLTEHGLS